MEQLRDIKVVVKDWDDLAVDTFPYCVDLMGNFAEGLDLPRPTVNDVRPVWGRKRELIIHALFGRYFPEMTAEQLDVQYMATVPEDFCPYPLPGIEEAVKKLLDMGLVVGVVSTGSRKWIDRAIERHYPSIKDSYLFVHGVEDCTYHKPDPRVFDPAFDILYPMGITEQQTIYTGDMIGDYEVARDRGLAAFIPVARDVQARQGFLAAGVDERLIQPSFTAIPDLLANYR